MSTDQAEPATQRAFAVLRSGRHGAPVFCESEAQAREVAAGFAEQTGGKYFVLRLLGAMQAEARWEPAVPDALESPENFAVSISFSPWNHWNPYP